MQLNIFSLCRLTASISFCEFWSWEVSLRSHLEMTLQLQFDNFVSHWFLDVLKWWHDVLKVYSEGLDVDYVVIII